MYRLSWEDYGTLIEDLWTDLSKKLEKNEVKIDAVVIILREGGFTGLPLAYKLNTYKVLTIQYKYMLYEGSNELLKVSDLSNPDVELPESPTFLICDTFPCGGKTKFLALNEVKARFPNARFAFASLVQDRFVDESSDFILNAYAFGVDENWKTNHPLFVKYKIQDDALNVVLPWENLEEESAAVNQNEWKYN